MTANRISGLVVLLFALALYFLIIPAHTETVGSGWLKPDTLPLVAACALGFLGLAQIYRARGDTSIGTTALALMSLFGFVIGGIPAIALFMALSGERRALLIGATSLAVPVMIWFFIVELLGRSLP